MLEMMTKSIFFSLSHKQNVATWLRLIAIDTTKLTECDNVDAQ